MGRLKRFKPATWTIIIIVVFELVTCLTELNLIPQTERSTFLLGKLVPILLTAIAGVLIERSTDAISTLANWVLAFSFLSYALVSSFYRPWYVVGLLQLLLLFAFLIPHSKHFFWGFLIISFSTFAASMTLRWPDVPENQGFLTLADWNNFGLQFIAMVLMVYYFFVRQSRYRARSEARLLSIGRNASRIMADLSSMSNLPRQSLAQVEDLVSGQGQSPLSEILNLTQSQLNRVRGAMLELSSLTANTTKDIASFDLPLKVKSLSETFAPLGKSQIQIRIEGDLWIHADRSLVSSLVFNLCSNSVKAFEERKIARPEMRWRLQSAPLILTFEDNAGGFTEEALRAIQKEIPYTGFTNGSGLGYQLIRDSVRGLGGKLRVENGENGIRLTFSLPSSLRV